MMELAVLKSAAWQRNLFRTWAVGFVCLIASSLFAETPAPAKPTVIVVVGAPGEEEFGKSFLQSADLWEKTSQQAGAKLIQIGRKEKQTPPDHDQLQKVLLNEPKEGSGDLWLVLIGHGTFDGKEAKFNLQGPDLTASELATWLEPFRRPLAVINTASSSGPFLSKLSAPGRVVITATRSGGEQNYARFGHYLSEAITDPTADLDKDGQTSLLEAFLIASRRTKEFYDSEGRLATEHALIDDNGDGLGTPPDWFRGIRAVKRAKEGAALDGLRAHQFHLARSEAERKLAPDIRARRDEVELAIAKLRDGKSNLDEDVYYARLETLLLEMAQLTEQTGKGDR